MLVAGRQAGDVEARGRKKQGHLYGGVSYKNGAFTDDEILQGMSFLWLCVAITGASMLTVHQCVN